MLGVGKFGQNSKAKIEAKDLKAELGGERDEKGGMKEALILEERKKDLLLLTGEADAGGSASRAPPRALVPKAADADDEDEDAESSSSSDGDDRDDEEELLAELERIKKEEPREAAKKAAEMLPMKTKRKSQKLRMGNPLLAIAGGGGEASFSMKRRWDDDVVFKHQSRGEPKKNKRFINDTIRNDFHTRFLNKYVR
eukprot:gene20555-27346_t